MAEGKSKKTVRQISVEMDAGHINRTEQYARQVGVLYDEAVREATRIGISLSAVDSSVPFTFDHYPEVKERVNKMVKSLFNGVNTIIASGTREEWLKSVKKNDAVVDWMLERTPFTRAQLEDMYDRNLEALAAFQKRKINGLGLSEKVWKLSEQFRNDMEMGLDIGLADGRSAAELSRDLRQYLNEPNRLFARIRDKKDSERFYLSENAKRYHPGEGMYRSSYKNAMRLTRTEINMAYRTADHERWKQLDFVVGFEVKLSNNHTLNGKAFTDICDELAGKYPKSFKFVGWHPQCRCFVIPILATEQEFVDWQQRRLDGDKVSVLRSGEEIEDVPNAFTQWISDNGGRISGARNLPYFIRDNSNIVPDLYVAFTKKFAASFNAKSASIAKRVGVDVTPVNVKSDSRIREKSRHDYGGYVHEVKDIVRNTFIIPQEEMRDKMIEEIKKEFTVIRLKNQNPSDHMGYSGTLINIKTSGTTFAEIQINTPQMIYGKELHPQVYIGKELCAKIKETTGLEPGLGHKYYEEWRLLKPGIPEQDAKRKMLKNKSIEYYTKLKNAK